MARRTSGGASIAAPGIVLGLGLGGFVDGILFHQIFQLHNMLSGKLPPDTMAAMRTNMLADGLFHAGVWIATLIGLGLLWNALNRSDQPPASGRAFIGYLLAGWGWFNLVEGLVDHQILGLHHVVERWGLSIMDWLFLVFGLILIVVGHRIGRSSSPPRSSPISE